MISFFTIFCIVISCLITILLPIILIIYFRRKYHISFKVVLFGALTFIVFALVLEGIVNMVILNGHIITRPIFIVIYSAFAAGIFEECGRYIVMKYFLKGHRKFTDGIAFGIGHGGIEAILIGFLASLNNLIYSIMINTNLFDKIYRTSPANTQSILLQNKQSLISTHSYIYLLPGVERIFAITAHLVFSVIVLYAIKTKKIQYLFLAILLHVLLDLAPALYQQGFLNLKITEFIIFIFFLLSLYFLFNFKKVFNNNRNIEA